MIWSVSLKPASSALQETHEIMEKVLFFLKFH